MLDALIDRGARARWLTVFGVCVSAFATTARWYGTGVNDSAAAAWPAWSLAVHGTLHLDGLTLPHNPWFVDAQGHTVSDRFPGVVLVAVPAQLLLRPFGPHPLVAATLTAVLLTAAAIATLSRVFERLGGSPRQAVSCALALGLATGFWPVASAELLPHGVDLFWVSLACLALTHDRLWLAGLALGPAVLTRPHLALVVAVLGLTLAWQRRSLRPALSLGVPAVGAVALLVTWNALLFGRPSIRGGYTSDLGPGQVFSGGDEWWRLLLNLAGSAVSPLRGLLLYSPVLLVAGYVLVRHWRETPAWTRGLAMGGAVYALVQLRIHTFEGGSGFYGNRYLLESLACAAPAAYVAYVASAPAGRRLVAVRLIVALSCAIQALGAFLGWSTYVLNSDSAWTQYTPYSLTVHSGAVGFLAAGGALVWFTVLALRPWIEDRQRAKPTGSLKNEPAHAEATM